MKKVLSSGCCKIVTEYVTINANAKCCLYVNIAPKEL